MNEEEYNQKVLSRLKHNTISLNAMKCINPSDELKIQLADTILGMLNKPGRTLPASYITSDNEYIKALAERTPVLYLEINKS